MREIKFRAWSVEHNRMIRSGDADTHLFRKGPIELIHVQWFDGGDEKPEDNKNFTIRQWDDVIYMQYTGLKDKNGKEIYEGDLLEFGGATKKVVFDRGCFYMEDTEPSMVPYILDIKYHEDTEIIGNIRENPELVK